MGDGLRGDHAVQLASALTWKESIGQEVLLGTFDGELWEAAAEANLHAWPKRRMRRKFLSFDAGNDVPMMEGAPDVRGVVAIREAKC